MTHTVRQQYGTGRISDGGILYAQDGKSLYAAQPGGLARFDVAPDGTLSHQSTIALPGRDGRQPVPAGLAWAPDGKDLLITLSANNTLGVLDSTTGTLTREIPVGNVPNSVVVVDGKAYVSNQGGRPATAGDRTDQSYGTPIVTNDNKAIPSTGSLSEVDLRTGTQVTTFRTGLQPTAVLAVGSTVLVANTGDDTVTSIDTAKQRVGRTFVANPAPGSPYGASPNGLAMLDPTHLAVSLGRDNASPSTPTRAPPPRPASRGSSPPAPTPRGWPGARR